MDMQTREPALRAENIMKDGSMIAEGCRFKGELILSGNIVLNGVVEGTIIVENDEAVLYVSETGAVIGKARASNVVLDGKLKGSVHAANKVTVSGTLEGDLFYGTSFIVMEGADINGKIARYNPNAASADAADASSGAPEQPPRPSSERPPKQGNPQRQNNQNQEKRERSFRQDSGAAEPPGSTESMAGDDEAEA
jgi:cytoskeletal protein CcmA (bactofilin family)